MIFTTHLLCAPDPQTVFFVFPKPGSSEVVTDHIDNIHHPSALCSRFPNHVSFFFFSRPDSPEVFKQVCLIHITVEIKWWVLTHKWWLDKGWRWDIWPNGDLLVIIGFPSNWMETEHACSKWSFKGRTDLVRLIILSQTWWQSLSQQLTIFQ